MLRQRMLLALAALAALALLGACAKDAPPVPPHAGLDSDREAPDEPTSPGAQITIAVVPKAVSQQFWTTVKQGAEAAAEEFNVDIIWKGPDSETDIAGQRSMIEDFVSQKVDAIVMAATDAQALVPTVQQAQAAGIVVITIDSGVETDVASLVATDNVAGARTAGETLIELIGGQGKVALIPFVKGAASSEQREQGFREAVEAAEGVELVAVDYSESDEGKAKDVTMDILTAHPDLAGIFAANEAGVVGAANALTERGKAGEIKLVGFDGSPAEVRLLQEGAVQALVVQNPFKMGYEGVRQAVMAIQNEPVEERLDTGVTVVTAENLDDPEVQQLLNPTGAE